MINTRQCGIIIGAEILTGRNIVWYLVLYLIMEIWKPIKGYDGFYEISDNGRIRNSTGKILHDYDNSKGYRYIGLSKNKVKTNFYVHRLVALNFLPIDPQRKHINHKNGKKGDNRLANIEWCNMFENMRHAYDNGLLVNPNAKMTERDVEIIRRMWAAKVHRDQIKEVFGISYGQISRIVNKQNWAS